MDLQVGLLGERLPALLARVRPQTLVISLVHFEAVAAAQDFGALATTVPAGPRGRGGGGGVFPGIK